MSVTIKIDPSAVAKILNAANQAGVPHHWVQINSRCAATVFQWEPDDSPNGLRIELLPDGRWTAELDLP